MAEHLPGLPDVAGILTSAELAATVDTIAVLQTPGGQIPWFPGGHTDPWNHIEAAMALALGGYVDNAEAAYRWLARIQHEDGSWCSYYVGDRIEDARRDTNVTAYIATGLWFHTLATGSSALLRSLWPTVERAMDFVCGLQWDGGELCWSLEPEDLKPGSFALLTGSCSAYFSLRCAVAAAEHLGRGRPDWELSAGRLAHAIANRPEAFADKRRWAMDWYYPVLCGAFDAERSRRHLSERMDEFAMDQLGIRCVSDRPWVTAAETAECVMALDAAGMQADAWNLFGWAQHLRCEDGSYWTGCVYPQAASYPSGERSTYTAAAIVLAANALAGTGPTAGLFRGEGLPTRMDLAEDTAGVGD
ncbi:MAG: prenyltransferase [Acidimicrobiales bacterium]